MISRNNFYKKLIIILERPGMYSIQKVEDIYLLFFAEIYFNDNSEIEEWSSKFREFVKSNINNALENFGWHQIIRLYSGSDAHSIKLFSEMFANFIEEN